MATKARAFQSHNEFLSKKKLQSAKPATFLCPPPSSIHLPSATQKKKSHLFICRAKNMVGEVVEVTDATWKEHVMDSDIPVIVEFWAPSCGPCKVVEPVLGDLAKEFAGKLACCKINTDDCLKMASQYSIRSIPTVLLFMDGEQKECITGAVRKSSFYEIIGKYL